MSVRRLTVANGPNIFLMLLVYEMLLLYFTYICYIVPSIALQKWPLLVGDLTPRGFGEDALLYKYTFYIIFTLHRCG